VAAMTDAVLDFYAEASPQSARSPSWQMKLQSHRQ
jgi:hypothetical protein